MDKEWYKQLVYSNEEKRKEYIRIAYYYHKAGLTQEQIAGKMNISRQRVNRILQKCIELGIVQIQIVGHNQYHIELEAKLEEKFGLKAVRIAGPVTEDTAYAALGSTAAQYVMDVIQNGDVIGFSRGQAMASLVEHLPRHPLEGVKAVQLMGSWNNHQLANVDDIVHRAAERLNAATVLLHAPVVVNKQELRESIMSEPYFREAYAQIAACNIAVVGISAVDEKLLTNASEIRQEDYRQYVQKHAVGEICSHFFDEQGNIVQTEMDQRKIVISLPDYMKTPLRIGVAGMPAKLRAIKGALRGGYINVLITDLDTAELLANSSR